MVTAVETSDRQNMRRARATKRWRSTGHSLFMLLFLLEAEESAAKRKKPAMASGHVSEYYM